MTATRIGRLGRPVTLVVCAAGWVAAATYLWRTSVPSLHLGGLDEHRFFSARLLDRAHSFGTGEQVLWLLGTLATLAALGVLAWRLPRSVGRLGLGRVSSAIVIGMVILVTLWFVSLPFGVVDLWWQHHWGLGPFNPATWLVAQRYALSVRAVSAMATIAIVVGLAVRFPRSWWIPGGAAFVGIMALLVFVSGWLGAAGAHSLQSPALRADVARIEATEGVHSPVRVLRVSNWTKQANAFTAGFGPSTHVVIWDTLLDDRFSRGEVDVVIAHEVGHARSRHILKGLGWYALFVFPAAFLVAEVTKRRGGLRNPANLPLAVLALTVVSLAAAPFENAVSRRYEAEADWRALNATHDPVSARTLFAKFAKTSLEEPDPPALDYVWLENHPTLMQRIAMTEQWAGRTGISPGPASPASPGGP
ncbi:MAG: M48 family metalloprotease [Actinomycetota bacterium]|nr:M48 family metalloprotease [Actinomycetota bacterium]